MSTFVELRAFYQLLNQSPVPIPNEVGHFNLFRVEDLLLPQQKPVSYSRRNFFKISLVEGHSKIHYADQVIEVPEYALVFTNPMIPYHWERISEQHSGYVSIFTEAFFSRHGSIRDYPVFQSAEAAVMLLSKDEALQYQQLFLRMHNELQGNYAYRYDLIRNLLMEVVHGAQKMRPAIGHPPAGANAAERITALFIELLERQFPIEMSSQVMQLRSPSDFAALLAVHVNHLNKALKETTGQTTSQLIKERVLQEAKMLLKSTNWTVNEIAWCLGFEEPNHFSAFFKNGTQMTPKSFRLHETV